MGPWRLGLGGSDHEFSAALMFESDVRVAVEQERLTRRKHGISYWYENPLQLAIDYCLSAEGVAMSDVERIVSSDVLPARVRHDLRDLPITLFPHHLCHAASAYMMLPYGAKAAVLVYDGYGSIRGLAVGDPLRNLRETFSFFIFQPDGFRTLGQTVGLGFIERDDFESGVTNSIGMLYELITSLLGYDSMDSGKTMGLASHGVPRYLGVLEDFVEFRDDPSDCFRCATDDPGLAAAIEGILSTRGGGFSVRADLAASAQALMNKALLHCAGLFEGHDIDYFCISGGCGLNTVANAFLVENSRLTVPVVIPPHCGDAGLAFGALWLEKLSSSGKAPEMTFRDRPVSPLIARPGRAYTVDECREAVQQFYPRLVLDTAISTPADLAKVLAGGAILGILNGGSEIGPRALGGRSILADPRSVLTRERINREIKHREPFRPLAPIVLEQDYDEYFLDERCADLFMLKVATARERLLREAPAVVHVDGTARVQVVTAESDRFLSDLLAAFRSETGTGILVNTSFNRKGEPIVETPLDAIDAFIGMHLDGLYLNGDFYRSADSMRPS